MAQPQDTPPTPDIVARNATQRTGDNLDRTILLGTFGPEGNRSALIRLSNGTVAKVGTGDRLGRDRIVAIDDGRLALAKNGTALWLTMPGGS